VPETRTVVLFDGVCNLCNGFVNFLIDRDPGERLAVAALQSDAGQRLLAEAGLPADSLQSVVVVDAGRTFTRSTAALRILRRLGGPWSVLALPALAVPRPLRDVVYDWIARKRYGWFGRQELCRIPTPELRRRFL
jgi:predicted DCC family thiol-disulfide oxidoreductase YuxK